MLGTLRDWEVCERLLLTAEVRHVWGGLLSQEVQSVSIFHLFDASISKVFGLLSGM